MQRFHGGVDRIALSLAQTRRVRIPRQAKATWNRADASVQLRDPVRMALEFTDHTLCTGPFG
jgi:hypothetical protein